MIPIVFLCLNIFLICFCANEFPSAMDNFSWIFVWQVRSTALEVNPGLIAICCGSYRRGKPTCGDVDVLITHPDGKSHKGVFSKILTSLKETGKTFFTHLTVATLDSVALRIRDFFTHYWSSSPFYYFTSENVNKLVEMALCDVVLDRLNEETICLVSTSTPLWFNTQGLNVQFTSIVSSVSLNVYVVCLWCV